MKLTRRGFFGGLAAAVAAPLPSAGQKNWLGEPLQHPAVDIGPPPKFMVEFSQQQIRGLTDVIYAKDPANLEIALDTPETEE